MQRHGYNEPSNTPGAHGGKGYVAGFGNFDVPAESLDEQRGRLMQHAGKYEPQPDEDDSGENDWAVAYTDMVTLLMAFFVILTSIAMAQPKGQEGAQPVNHTRENVQVQNSPFDGMGISIAVDGRPTSTDPYEPTGDDVTAIEDPYSKLPPKGQEQAAAAPKPAPQPEAEPSTEQAAAPPQPTPAVPDKANTELASKLQQMVTQSDLGGQVQVISGNDTVTLRISDKILFSSGRSDLEQTGQALVARLSAILAQSGGEISIEGHTDNIPIRTAQFPSNWELSAARAAMVLRQLVALGLPADKLRAIAYADTKPVKDNSNPANRAENRRVELVISSAAKN